MLLLQQDCSALPPPRAPACHDGSLVLFFLSLRLLAPPPWALKLLVLFWFDWSSRTRTAEGRVQTLSGGIGHRHQPWVEIHLPGHKLKLLGPCVPAGGVSEEKGKQHANCSYEPGSVVGFHISHGYRTQSIICTPNSFVFLCVQPMKSSINHTWNSWRKYKVNWQHVSRFQH